MFRHVGTGPCQPSDLLCCNQAALPMPPQLNFVTRHLLGTSDVRVVDALGGALQGCQLISALHLCVNCVLSGMAQCLPAECYMLN
jgi:hypothetical protein